MKKLIANIMRDTRLLKEAKEIDPDAGFEQYPFEHQYYLLTERQKEAVAQAKLNLKERGEY